LNIVFSLDSVITAVGMAKELWVMIVAVVISMGVMLLAAEPIARFVQANVSVKILALSFLVLIGVSLLAEAFEQHLDKGYIYFAMAFAFSIELINLRLDRKKADQSSSK
ncbi:MAG: TerC family protein, partial [Bacteroidia bacterium]